MRLLCLPYFQETGGTHRFSGRGSKKSKPDKKIMQPIVRTVREGMFVAHCYLACGHVITIPTEDLEESAPPSSIECWACEEESKKGSPAK